MKYFFWLAGWLVAASAGFAEETVVNWHTYDVASIRVVDFRQPLPFSPRRAAPRGISFRKAPGENAALDLTFTPTSTLLAPGILLKPPLEQRFWNLAAYQELQVEIENLDTDQQNSIRMRIFNATTPGSYQLSNDSGITLNPGEKAVLKLYYPHADDFAPSTMFGVGATPPGIPSIRTLNATRVDGIAFFVENPRYQTRNGGMKLRIGNLKLVTPRRDQSRATDDPKTFFPFIDRYGQYKHAEWPEKIHSDADFQRNAAWEKRQDRPPVPGWNRFGGWEAGPALQATGFFRTEKFQGKWFLVDPTGRLFFSFGLNSITMGEFDLAGSAHPDFWFETPRQGNGWNFTVGNLEKKYGAAFRKIYPETVYRRLQNWGINTVGNWSSPEFLRNPRVPYVTNIVGIRGKFPRTAPLSLRDPDDLSEAMHFPGLWDVFDPGFAAQLRRHAAALQKELPPRDPYCLGIFIDNEINWGHHTYWGDRTALARSVLLADPALAAKREFRGMLQRKYPTIDALNQQWGSRYHDWEEFLTRKALPDRERAREDLIAFNRHFIDCYYRTCRAVVREFFPDTLYLGSRINLHHADVLEIAAKYCDVMSLNVYSQCLEGLRRDGFPADKPFIVTEFQVGVLDRGMFSAQPRPAGVTQADRALAYRRILEGLLRHPQAVGAHYFCWRDQPNTGRRNGRWQENFAVGVIDKSDTPYWEMTDVMRQVAEKGLPYRLNPPSDYDLTSLR